MWVPTSELRLIRERVARRLRCRRSCACILLRATLMSRARLHRSCHRYFSHGARCNAIQPQAQRRRQNRTVARTRNENRCYRSPTRSAMAQTARHPYVDITDTTPAHIAAALRPDRHHTHGLNTTILGWRLYEVHTLQPFCMNSSRPGRPMSANYSLPHGPHAPPCGKVSGVAWQYPQQEEFAQKGGAVVCASRRHQQVEMIERPARARDGWRCRQHR